MEKSLFQKNGSIWTRFKVRMKEKEDWLLYLAVKYRIDTTKPVKVNSRYIYFEKEGDLLN